MTIERFTFQRSCVAQTTGKVLNVGANEDPANLKGIDPDRVINCDIEKTDSYLNRPNKVDVLFDAKEKWPFEADYAELVVFGDIIEHFYPEEALAAMKEAHRVSEKVCVTVPSDGRFKENDDVEERNGYRTHCYQWTEKTMTMLLEEAGFEIITWRTVDYGFVPEGYFVLAERGSTYEKDVNCGLSFTSDYPREGEYVHRKDEPVPSFSSDRVLFEGNDGDGDKNGLGNGSS
jgi:predicted SAM-dependent methyltransferase